MPANLTGDPNYDREEQVEEDRQRGGVKSKEELDKTSQVETYVEIKVQYHKNYSEVDRTHTDEGTMPRWNEILNFRLDSETGEAFTQEQLAKSKTTITASLFDKQTYMSYREGERVYLDEHRFLGSVEIPLVTLLSNSGKTDFNLRIQRPICLPTYRVLSDEIYFMSQETLEK